MTPANKEISMKLFKDGHAHILIATTVIEVGVDIPNATVMIIESAERFGLSQLTSAEGTGRQRRRPVILHSDELRQAIKGGCKKNRSDGKDK